MLRPVYYNIARGGIYVKADLHIHSSYSDSSRSPEEIVTLAKERNVALISVCDHATIDAYGKLSQICLSNHIKCVLGIELNALWNGESIHMLAYNFDKDNEQMKLLINKQHRAIECEYIVFNMSRDYPQMSLEDYSHFEYPKEKGGWKYLYYAVAKGAAKTYEEANETIFSKYSAPNHLSDFGECSLQDFCRTVKEAGGIPVMAHPGYLYRRNPENFTAVLEEMKEFGIKGIECYYPSHSKQITDICKNFCKRNDMRITAGSDCHGDFDKNEGFTVGALDVSLSMLDLKGII